MEKVYCYKCHFYDIKYHPKVCCEYIKKKELIDTPIARELKIEWACPHEDNKDNNCFYYTPRQPEKKEPTHFLGKISNFFKKFIG